MTIDSFHGERESTMMILVLKLPSKKTNFGKKGFCVHSANIVEDLVAIQTCPVISF